MKYEDHLALAAKFIWRKKEIVQQSEKEEQERVVATEDSRSSL